MQSEVTAAATRHEQLLALLWDSMKRDPEHKDRVQTGWGTKTRIGLVACIDRIFEENPNEKGDPCKVTGTF